MSEKPTRSYTSPLRDSQVRQTQDRILDALTELLNDKRADEVTTREIADRAGVSQPTVYRYFPDREALLVGLASRRDALSGWGFTMPAVNSVDDFGTAMSALFALSDEYAVEATAEALLNADPRRYAADTAEHSERLRRAVASEFPQFDERARVQLAALLRCIGSAQTWLRMREEFDVPGTESGPLVQWAINALMAEARRAMPAFPEAGEPLEP